MVVFLFFIYPRFYHTLPLNNFTVWRLYVFYRIIIYFSLIFFYTIANRGGDIWI